MKFKNITKDERPMEKLSFYGKEALSDKEILAILLRTGSKEKNVLALSEEILYHIGYDLSLLVNFSIEELIAINGIGVAKASGIIAAIELGRRVLYRESKNQVNLQSVGSVVEFFRGRIENSKVENFEIALLNTKGILISVHNVSKGDLSSSIVHPRETFKEAIKRSASSIICVHNHPSGDCRPSQEDIRITRRLDEAGNVLGISLLDHIIIGKNTYFSFKEHGMIK